MSESSKSKSDEYDPVIDYHYLKFENRCLRASGDDFQNLFEAIMVRARPGEFERVRPYGKYGDRKCDGLIESEGIIFQVYSPDELKEAEVQKKIDEDLEGAVRHWSDILKKWIFVYNVKRGITANIKLMLQQKRQQYLGIEIDCWSNDYLWEIARNQLTLQQCSQIFGAPPYWSIGKPKKNFYGPNPPSHLLERSTDLNSLKNLVLTNSSISVGVTGLASKVGMYGMGGIGKSVLAGMLARDEEVQATFPDGVFWITLGQEPVLTMRQLDFAKMLGDTYPNFQDLQQGKIHLNQLLENRCCLLILDDVWKIEQVDAFNVLSSQSKLLFTTRDRRIVEALNAVGYQVNLLNDDEALELLASCSGQSRESLPPEAYCVVEECGNLPLALAMIGAIAKARPNRWDNLLHKLQNADLDKIKHQFPDYPYPDLLKAIQVSVDALEPEIRTRYLDFAVFPEDVSIPEATLRIFWEPEGLDEYGTQDVIDVLVERSLARRDNKGNLSLHDLQYDYVRKQTDNLPALHNRLLNGYATRCPQGWHTGLNDGYFFEHLAFHLIEASRREELYHLLVGSSEWMESKFTHCKGDSAYIADIAMALNELEDQTNMNRILLLTKLSTAHQVVYERNQHDRDHLEILTWLGHTDQALNHARLTLDPNKRFVKLLTIYDVLHKQAKSTSDLLDELWQAARCTQNNWHEPLDTWALGEIAVRLHLSGRQADANLALSEAEVTALNPNPDWFYYQLIDSASDNKLVNCSAEDSTQLFTRDWLQVEAIRRLAIAFSKCGRNTEAYDFFMQAKRIAIEKGNDQQFGSCKFKPQLLEELGRSMIDANFLEEAEAITKLITEAYHAAKLWRDLGIAHCRTLYHQVKAQVAFQEAEQAIYKIEDKNTQLIELAHLAVALVRVKVICKGKAVPVFDKVLELIDSFDEEYQKLRALEILVNAYAQANYFSGAKEILQKIEHPYHRDSALRNLMVEMSKVSSCEAEQIALAISDENKQVDALVELALNLARSEDIKNACRIFYKVQERLPKEISEEFSDFRFLDYLASALIDSEDFFMVDKIIDFMSIDLLNGVRGYEEAADCKVSVMIKFATALSRSNYKMEAKRIFNAAKNIVEKLKVGQNKLELYDKLKIALTDVGYLEEAYEISREFSRMAYIQVHIISPVKNYDIEEKEEAIKQLIIKGAFQEAFMKLRHKNLTCFLYSLAQQASTFEKISKGLSVEILREALHIAGWVDKGYLNLYESLNL